MNLRQKQKNAVFGIEGLKPAWEFRAEKVRVEREKVEAELKQSKKEEKKTWKKNDVNKSDLKEYKIKLILPEKISKASYIDAEKVTPTGFIVMESDIVDKDSDRTCKSSKKTRVW